MTKRELIDEILTLNCSAKPEFLAKFADEDLRDYLDHLHVQHRPRLSGDARRYEKYFNTAQATWADRRCEVQPPPAEPVPATVASQPDQTAESSFAEESAESSNDGDWLF